LNARQFALNPPVVTGQRLVAAGVIMISRRHVSGLTLSQCYQPAYK